MRLSEIRPVQTSDMSYAVPDDVPAGKYWTVALQLGSSNRWREYNGGKWELAETEVIPSYDPSAPAKTVRHFRHVPAMHIIDHVPSATVNGLLASSRQWLTANRQCDARSTLHDAERRVQPHVLAGQIGRQILVTAIEPCDPPPRIEHDATATTVAVAVVAAIRELIASGALAPAAPPTTKGK